jgi:glyceraldehyde 3-phosphate dehydrogenase
MPIKIAINGFGRIGRPALRRILDNHPDLQVAAINDLTEPEILAHLLKYDSVYGIYKKAVKSSGKDLSVDGKKIEIFAEKNPTRLPWKKLGIDVVLECSGVFTEYEGAKKHLDSGAKKVIISAPSKSEEVPTFVLGVNEEKYNPRKYDLI